jgi:hypothetical protein
MKINWTSYPKESNFLAAMSYLTLLLGGKKAEQYVKDLRMRTVERFAAKDVLRASRTQPLAETVEHVKTNLSKMAKGEEISPVLLCRHKGHLIIADGTHRISAIWHTEEDMMVHALIV